MEEEDVIDLTKLGKASDVLNDPRVPSRGMSRLESRLENSEASGSFQGDSKYDTGLLHGMNQNVVRSRNQPWYDQLGNSLAKIVPGAALSMIENVGDLAEFFDTDEDKEYSNIFTELALKGKEALDEKFHTYQETPSNKFASIHDSGWWFNFGDGIAQSIAGFATVGAGVGKGLGLTAKAINGALRSGELGIKIGQGAAQLTTATALSYTEGVQIGAGVYQNIKEDVLKNGYDYGDGIKVPVDDIEARRIASVGSSEAVKLNTILGTGINITGISPLFKSYGKLSATVKSQLPRGAKESIPQWLGRLTELEKTLPQASPLRFLAQEAVQESFEEGGINLFAESEGYRKSGASKNMVRSDLDNAIDRFTDILFSEEGGVNALGGAVGGIVQSGALEHAPIHNYTDKDGNTQKVSARTLEHLETEDRKNEVIHTLKTDIDYIQDKQKALNAAVLKGNKFEIEEAKHDLFNVAALKSFRNESVDALSNELNKYSEVDNTKIGEDGQTEAQRRGLATDTNDNKYREIATKKAADIHILNKEYRNLSSIFSNSHARDEAFRQRLNIYSTNSVADEITKEITEKESTLLPFLSDPTLIEGVKQNAELKAYDLAIAHLESKRTPANKEAIDRETNLLRNERTVVQSLHDDLKKGNKGLTTKIKSNEGVANPLISSYTDKLIADRRMNTQKLEYSKILDSPKKFEKEIKQAVDKIEKTRQAQENIAATKVEKQKETTDLNKASETKKASKTPIIEEQLNPEDDIIEEANLTPLPEEIKPEDIHKLAKSKQVDYESKDFMNKSKELTGKEHLDDMTSLELQKVQNYLTSLVKPLASNQVDAINISTPIYQGKNLQEVEDEHLALANTVKENTIKDNNTNGKQNKIAYLAQEYEESERGEKSTINPFIINHRYKILHSSSFNIGTELVLKLAPAYEEIKEEVGSVPIEIRYKGTIVGYVSNYNEETDPRELYDIRKYIIDNGEIKTTIQDKDWGVLNVSLTNHPTSEAFPILPKFAIGKDQGAYINRDTQYPNALSNRKDLKSGYLYAIVTTPNNKELALPLNINRTSTEAAKSIINALNVFINADQLLTDQKQVVEEIFNNYGINITTQKGLQDYVNMFIVTTDLQNPTFVSQKNDVVDKDEYYVQVTGNGIAYLQSGKAIKDKNNNLVAPEIGKNTPDASEYLEHLEDFLKHTYARIDLTKIQANEAFKAPLIHITPEGELKYSDISYPTYADYIADNSYTNIVGVKLSETEQTVFVQPTIYFSTSFLTPDSKKAILATPTATTKEGTKKKAGFGTVVKNSPHTEQLSLAGSKQDDESLMLPGFESFYQQQKAVETIASSVLSFNRANQDKRIFYNDSFSNFKEELEVVIKENPDNKSFQVIKDNLPELKNLVKDKLDNLQLLGKEEPLEENETDDVDISGVDALYREDDWVFKRDSKANALRQVKQFLAFIPKTEYNKKTKEYIQVNNYLSTEDIILPDFLSYDKVFEELKAILSDTDVEPTWDSMYKKLQDYQEGKPWIHTLLDQIKPENYTGDLERLKHQFVSTMSSSYSGFKTLLWKEKKGKYYLNIIDTDQSSIEKNIRSHWSAGFRDSDLLTTDSNNNLITNQEKVKEIVNKIDQLEKNPIKEAISNLLEEVGISLSSTTLDTLVDKKFNNKTISGQFTESTGLFRLIKERLLGKQTITSEELLDEDTNTDLNNPIVNNSAITALAKLESTNSEYAYSNSYRNGEGESVYSYTFNKAITKKYKRLLNDPNFVKSLLSITFTKSITSNDKVIYKSWLYQLSTNDSFKNIFSIAPFDTIKQSRPGSKGLKLSSMADLDVETTQLALIQNSGQTNKGVGRVIKYLITVPSKTTAYIVQAAGHDVKLLFKENGDYSFDPDTINALYSIAASEHNRIISQEGRENDNKAYNQGSSKFFFFPIFNSERSPELYKPDGTIKLPTTVLSNGRTVEDYIRDKVIALVKYDIKNKIQDWKNSGIVVADKLKIVDESYKNNIIKRQVKDNEANQVTFAVADYIIQNILAKFNTHQMFIGDPALFYKNNIDETWANVDKRIASLIAPANELSLVSPDERFISIKLVDREKGNHALNYAQLAKRLSSWYEDQGKANPYEEIDGTDAQEYTTLKEHLFVQYRRGNLSTNTYNNLLSRIATKKNNLVLTKSELGTVLGAMKPVYSDTLIDSEADVATEQYVKSSSIPLIPQLTEGLEIDKLRVAMEAHENKTKLNVRAVFNSGTKVGGLKSINIWNTDGTIKDNLDLSNYGVTLNRSGFGIQQDIPFEENKQEVVKATQPTKQLFDALQDVENFKYNNKIWKGKDLQKEYDDLHKELYENGLKSLHNQILVNDTLNIPKLQKIILEGGKTRGYTPAQLSFLRLDENDLNFAIPFWANPSSSQIESLVTSLYTNKVLKQKLHGRSYVLVSEEGFQGNSKGIVYVNKGTIETTSKTEEDLLNETLPEVLKNKLVNISTTDPISNENTIEEQTAEEAINEIKKQHKRLEDLLNCLNK